VIQAICFDAFGTLVEITDKRRPFRALLQGGVQSITAEDVLTRPLNLQEVAASLSTSSGGGLADLEVDLQAEWRLCPPPDWDRRDLQDLRDLAVSERLGSADCRLLQLGAALWGAIYNRIGRD
jgi:hypothetical protein